MLDPSAHLDSFTRDHLPPRAEWPVFDKGGLPELDYPKRLNAAVELLDRMVEKGFGARPCLRREGVDGSRPSIPTATIPSPSRFPPSRSGPMPICWSAPTASPMCW